MDARVWQHAELEALRVAVEERLDALLPPPAATSRLQAAMRYAVLGPGKRIRPLLALLTATHLGCPPARALPGACALELVHAASLVLDDLPCMDDAELRRGQPALHRRFGEDVAVLTGVALLNLANGMIAESRELTHPMRTRILALLSAAIGQHGLIGGQDLDLQASAALDADAICELHRRKTAALFVAAVEIGAVCAGADEAALDGLRRFAAELGLAFQALDDLADVREAEAERPVANLAAVLGSPRLRDEASARLDRAKLALAGAGAPLSQMCHYVDLLISTAPV